MTEDLFARLDAAAEHADRIIAGTRPDQLDDPTPCTDWDVRALLNHMIGGNLIVAATVAGAPSPDRSRDFVGADHVSAYRSSVKELAAAIREHDVLAGRYQLPFGEVSGAQLVTLRANDTLVHAWDLARATGQPRDIDPDLCDWSMSVFRSIPMRRGEGGPFGPERTAPPDAGPADRLAAFVGREP